MTAVTINQQAYRFYEDGTEAGSTAIGTQDTALSRDVNTGPTLLLRVRVNVSGAVASSNYQLQRNIGGAGFADVTTSSTGAKAFNSTNLTDQGATTERLTGGSGTFVAGLLGEAGVASNYTFSAARYTEFLYTLTLIPADLANGTSLTFRILRNGGTMTYNVTPTITVVNTGSNKTLAADAGSFALTGTAATLKHGYAVGAGAGSYALSGTAASLLHKWKIDAGAGSYALTGSAATLRRNLPLVAGAGSYSLSGTAAALLHAWRLPAGGGSYLLSGSDATLSKSSNKSLAAGAGSFNLSGTAASLLHAWKIAAGAASYSINGTAASLLHGYRVTAGVGSFTLSGTAASLLHAYKLAAGAGSYTLTGTAATLRHAYQLTAGVGSFAFTGTPATLRHAFRLSAQGGAFVWSGSDAGLIYVPVIASDLPHNLPFMVTVGSLKSF